ELIAAPKGAEARMWGWAVIMRAGDYNVPHVHPDAHVSGVYYVQVPDLTAADDDPSPGGSLVFFDPRTGAAMHMMKGHRSIHSYVPTAGSLIVFPSYHMHGVFPFRGSGERISVAFNVRLNLT
ncbi:MAG: putative 2OG-Fe(II) oxygenase, partial [Dongiaceae bacterium]